MIDLLLEQLEWLSGQEDDRVSVLAPFLGRSLLDLATTALIGRFDPIRVLFIRRVQAHPDYTTSQAWKASIRWQGDVLAEKEKDLWGQNVEYKKVTRALLGDYYDELIWRPAVLRLASLAPRGDRWLAELAGIQAESFVARKRDDISRQYSSLSKGIHHEFVMPPGAVYDRATLSDLVRGTIHSIADLALVSQFVPHAEFLLSPSEAVEVFNRIEQLEVMP
ncbi:MAG: hypothetical protein HY791_30400 [Deltaproteobacteria bacterium]|nr:hypothetical protein [Deltaproteobacteria bacterium]